MPDLIGTRSLPRTVAPLPRCVVPHPCPTAPRSDGRRAPAAYMGVYPGCTTMSSAPAPAAEASYYVTSPPVAGPPVYPLAPFYGQQTYPVPAGRTASDPAAVSQQVSRVTAGLLARSVGGQSGEVGGRGWLNSSFGVDVRKVTDSQAGGVRWEGGSDSQLYGYPTEQTGREGRSSVGALNALTVFNCLNLIDFFLIDFLID